MTVFLPLQASTPLPHSPSFLLPSPNVDAQLSKVVQAIMKAKRIVIICGAGISVRAGIPDFRSSEGLFKSLKRDNPRETLASGKDLFDASVFNSENTTSLFCQMMARLSDLSQTAEPTPFHHVLRALDDRGKLLRVYTQNIDAIEEKCGLSFGVPEFEGKRYKGRSKEKHVKSMDETAPSCSSFDPCTRLPSPPAETPRCIPLHGTLQNMHCQICNHSFPLQNYLPTLAAGQPPQCPECMSLEETRQLVGKRPRGIGKLRPSVVLYNEAHKDGEGVGEVVRKDLIGSSKGKGRSGADLLLVVGTSLRVPGTKRMVREFAKAVRVRGSTVSSNDDGQSSGPSTPAPSPRRTPTSDEEPSMKAVYLNLDFPVPVREWDGVFDAWVQGDAQQFAQILQEEIEKEAKIKEIAIEKKRKREEEAALTSVKPDVQDIPQAGDPAKPMKKKFNALTNSAKRQKISYPPSPPKSPILGETSVSNVAEANEPSKLVLRIPARPFLVPEVYITTLPPTKTPMGTKMPQGVKLPPTPETLPPKPRQRNKAGHGSTHARSATSVPRKQSPKTPKRQPSPLSSAAVEDDNDNADVLPETFVRTLQQGLRRRVDR